MDEQEKVTKNLIEAAEQSAGRPLTQIERQQMADFAENFLLLLDDTEE